MKWFIFTLGGGITGKSKGLISCLCSWNGLTILAVLLGLVGCTSVDKPIRPITESLGKHPADSLLSNDWMGYRDTEIAHLVRPTICGPGARKTVFFITLSGGGSRAAYFAARVLHEIDRIGPTPLTQDIDGIFSVSGGSFTAALYGISSDIRARQESLAGRPVWSESLTDEVLSKHLTSSMAKELLYPNSLFPYLFGNLSRTDLLENSIESEIFQNDGAPITFQSLNPDRPPIFIIATIATTERSYSSTTPPFGSLFIFATSDLAKLGDDLASVPVAKAVSASAAFPGLLSPVTLPRYRRSVHETQLGAPRFVHLFDGGNADNLGLLGVKRALLEDDYRLLRDCENVVVLSVDAFGRQGVHSDSSSHEASPVGWFFDSKSALASFDALLAANRARLLGEFKSRVFMPPGSEELCKKDGLSDDVCAGGVRADWDKINHLLKQKLYFVHLNFGSPEVVLQNSFSLCNPECPVMPVDGFRLRCEQDQLKQRLEEIPTTFGLSYEEMADIRAFVSSLNHTKNICLHHLWDVVANRKAHDESFYELASASCDETPILKRGKIPVVKPGGHMRGNIFGDVVVKDIKRRYKTFDEKCQESGSYSHEERIQFLYDAKSKLIAAPEFLSN